MNISPPLYSSLKELDDRAHEILRLNDRGSYTVPTQGLYPFQWNWDSAFAAWGFSTYDIPRAWTELETLFSAQWDDGMVPHIVFHQQDPGYFPGPEVWESGRVPPTSGISQPPVAATMARRVYEADPEAGQARLAGLYPKLLAFHRWWMWARVKDGAVCVSHPWESGRDNCPDWDVGMAGVDGSNVGPYQRRDTGHVDPTMRPTKEEYDRYLAILQYGRACGWDQAQIRDHGPFLMADPGCFFILIRAQEDLAALGRALGEDVTEIETALARLRAGVETIWNPAIAAYDARDMRTGAFAGILGSSAFLSYLAGAARPEIDAHLARIWDRVSFGIPSSDPDAPYFEPRRYWRGPTWPFLNALIAIGLADSGHSDLAERLRRETVALIRGGGFNEYFDPLDGTACGGRAFTWTAAIWLAWARLGETD